MTERIVFVHLPGQPEGVPAGRLTMIEEGIRLAESRFSYSVTSRVRRRSRWTLLRCRPIRHLARPRSTACRSSAHCAMPRIVRVVREWRERFEALGVAATECDRVARAFPRAADIGMREVEKYLKS